MSDACRTRQTAFQICQLTSRTEHSTRYPLFYLTDRDIYLTKRRLVEGPMITVTVSPKFQVVIPREVRESLSIKPGDKLQIINYAGRIELMRIKAIKNMRGFLKGIDTTVEREKVRT